MATIADTLVTKYGLDASGYAAGADQVTASTVAMEAAVGGAAAVVAVLTAGLALAAAATIGVVKGMADLAIVSSKAGAELESVKMGFQAYAASASEAEENLKRLRLVAQLPGLGFKEAIEGSTRLQAVGMDARLAERSLMAFGNALALVGGGKAELDGVVRAISQISSKGVVSAEEINQIAERVPQIRQAMKEAFGTANTEMLQKSGMTPEAFIVGMVGALEKLPKATGGAKNAFENLQDSAFVALATIGEQVNKVFGPLINTVSSFIDYLGSSGMLAKFSETFAGIFKIDNDGVINILSFVAAFLEKAPLLMQGVIAMARQVGSQLMQTLNGLIDAINMIVDNPIGRHFGATRIPHIQDIPAQLVKNFTGIDVSQRAGEIAEGFKSFKPAGLTDNGPGGFTSSPGGPPAMAQQTDYLREIAANTAPIPNLTRMAFGDVGFWGGKGVSAVDVGGRQGAMASRSNGGARLISVGVGMLIDQSLGGRSRRMA